MDKIAVIMSIYKGDEKDNVKAAIDSILEQTYHFFTLFIMVDGPVKDSVLFLLEGYRNNPKVCITLRDSNEGLAASLNELIEIVKKDDSYKFLARMDSDDKSLPHRFTEQINFMSRHPSVDVIGSYCHEFGSEFALDKKVVPLDHDSLVSYTLYKCPFIHPTVMFRISIFTDDNIRYPLKTCLSEDLGLWFLLLRHGCQFANVDKVLLHYRIDNSTLERRSGFKKAFSEVKLRLIFAYEMRNKSLKIYMLIFARGILALCPRKMKEIVYKRFR